MRKQSCIINGVYLCDFQWKLIPSSRTWNFKLWKKYIFTPTTDPIVLFLSLGSLPHTRKKRKRKKGGRGGNSSTTTCIQEPLLPPCLHSLNTLPLGVVPASSFLQVFSAFSVPLCQLTYYQGLSIATLGWDSVLSTRDSTASILVKDTERSTANKEWNTYPTKTRSNIDTKKYLKHHNFSSLFSSSKTQT